MIMDTSLSDITEAHAIITPTVLKYYTMKQMHSRDITILIVLLWFSIVWHYSNLFQYFFYRSNIVPTLVENS